MRKSIWTVGLLAVVFSGSFISAVDAHILHHNNYYLYPEGSDEAYAKIEEFVYDHEQTYEMTGQEGYLYAYHVSNMMFNDPDLWCWGLQYPEGIIWSTGPAGWSVGVDCPSVPGLQFSWTTSPGSGIDKGDCLDLFWYVSANPPFQMVDAYVHSDNSFGYGQISAPIPEPGTMVLIGSGLVGLVAFARRRFVL